MTLELMAVLDSTTGATYKPKVRFVGPGALGQQMLEGHGTCETYR